MRVCIVKKQKSLQPKGLCIGENDEFLKIHFVIFITPFKYN